MNINVNQNQLLSFIQVFNQRLGSKVPLSNDILTIIEEKIKKNLRYCDLCKIFQCNEIVPLRSPKLGYDFVCHNCWKNSCINWDDEFW